MQYTRVVKGIFLSRPNRFVARVLVGDEEIVCHVKNTGRCRELLVPGNVVYLEPSDNPQRKTPYDLIAVERGERLINMDSQAPNRVWGEYLAAGGLGLCMDMIRPEYRFGDSRLDFYARAGQTEYLFEVKGVTLEENGVVRFPDAPTQRGVRHIEELCRAAKAGFHAHLVFVIQMQGVDYLEPNDATQPAFGQALRKARAEGVTLLAYDCRVQPGALELHAPVPLRLEGESAL